MGKKGTKKVFLEKKREKMGKKGKKRKKIGKKEEKREKREKKGKKGENREKQGSIRMANEVEAGRYGKYLLYKNNNNEFNILK